MNCQDLIAKGVCKADCCGPVPMYPYFFRKYKGNIQRPILKTLPFPGGMQVPVTENLCCPFLTWDYKCAIYRLRPDVCRKFGSGHPHPKLQCPHQEPVKK